MIGLQILIPILWEAFEGIESPVLFFWATRKRYDIPGINPKMGYNFDQVNFVCKWFYLLLYEHFGLFYLKHLSIEPDHLSGLGVCKMTRDSILKFSISRMLRSATKLIALFLI